MSNTSKRLSIKNVKFSGYDFYTNKNWLGNFQICITVPLNKQISKKAVSCSFQNLSNLLQYSKLSNGQKTKFKKLFCSFVLAPSYLPPQKKYELSLVAPMKILNQRERDWYQFILLTSCIFNIERDLFRSSVLLGLAWKCISKLLKFECNSFASSWHMVADVHIFCIVAKIEILHYYCRFRRHFSLW